MRLSRKRLMVVLIVIMPFVVFLSYIFWMRIQPPKMRIADLALVLPRESNDRLAEELVRIGSGIKTMPDYEEESEVDEWIENNRAVLQNFQALKVRPRNGPGFHPPARLATHNRFITEVLPMDKSDSRPRTSAFKRLSILLAHNARKEFRCGREEAGMQGLRDAVDVTGLLLHNPELVQFFTSGVVWAHLAEIIYLEVPDERLIEAVAWVPDQAEMRQADRRHDN
ncbi:MAG: hypothetical protein QNK37_37060 [Acidobacteriota bacterium]|nr:hypothetical protein [Acidobacteriota bacterium]